MLAGRALDRFGGYVRAAVAAGALSYVIKCRIASDLLPALRAASAGRTFFSPAIRLA
jgi:DNA-binding NarL/FixJ family response regulator